MTHSKQPTSLAQRLAQQAYRRKQRERELVRVEIQMKQAYKHRFDELVAAKAKDLPENWHRHKRLAQARRLVIEEALANTQTSFITLQDHIAQLKAEVSALSPAFFEAALEAPTSFLPESIKSLPNEAAFLKQLLAQFYKAKVLAERQQVQQTNAANQYKKLYEAVEQENQVSVLFQHDAHAALSLVYCACDERMVINSASEGIE